MKNSTFITRVTLRNYKSIASCEVGLRPLMFLVGPNGAGKSNFLDSLRFVADALNLSLDHAIRDRGGINDVHHRSGGRPKHFSIRLDFTLSEGSTGHYAFRIGDFSRGRYKVQTEECVLRSTQQPTQEDYFYVKNGTVAKTNVEVAPAAAKDRLYLVNASGLREFRPVYEAFSHMGFYSLNLDTIKDLQAPDPGNLLTRDGSNLASVFKQLSPSVKGRVKEYLATVVPSVDRIETRKYGPKEALVFIQDMQQQRPHSDFSQTICPMAPSARWGFLSRCFKNITTRKSVCCLWELKNRRAHFTRQRQGCCLMRSRTLPTKRRSITSHSPDLLDDKDLDPESILAVETRDGITVIAHVMRQACLCCTIGCIQRVSSCASINCNPIRSPLMLQR